MAGSKVLLIDDDAILLEVLPETLCLLIADIDVDTASSTRAALDRLDTTQYDAIISDISMPQMNGLALVAEIKKRKIGTPVLLMSGSPDMVDRACKSGVFAVIPKPFNRVYIKGVLSRALRYGRTWRQIRQTHETSKAQVETVRLYLQTLQKRIAKNQLLLQNYRSFQKTSTGVDTEVHASC